jgi:GAF domain-containing protein
LGTLDLPSPEVGAFHDADLDFSRALTAQAAIALENARLRNDAQRHTIELSVLTWAILLGNQTSALESRLQPVFVAMSG